MTKGTSHFTKSTQTPLSLLGKSNKVLQGDDAWVEVIHQMDRVYSELVESQVALEEKNIELENAQEFITSVLSAMSDLLIVCDTKGRIEQVNDAMVRLTGMPATNLVGQPLSKILIPTSENSKNSLLSYLADNQPVHDCEVRVIGAEGESLSISINCSPRHDHRNRLVGMVLIGRPMGELQRANRKLDDALKNFEIAQQHLVSSEKMAALGRLVAGVAHELNNPISFIFGNMHSLKSYGEKITHYLQATKEQILHEDMQKLRHELQIERIAKDIMPLVEGTLEGAERVSDIVQDLRRFSGSQKEEIEEFFLKPVVQTATNWVLRGTKSAPKVRIICEDNLSVFSKKGSIHQVIVNLMQNAVDAIESMQGEYSLDANIIKVTVEQSEGKVSIAISDKGTGIANENMDKLFEPFFTTKPVGKGTGLGLYLSYRMAEEIGATLQAKNNLERGACFTLSLPKSALEVKK